MSMRSEFKAFVLRGNVVDMAVGIVIGAAFGKIVSTLVSSIVMPPIGLLTSGIDFSSIKTVLKAAGADGKGEVAIEWGVFINTVISFVIIAFVIFLVMKAINTMIKKEEKAAPPAAPPADVVLLTEIRDLLRKE